MSKSQESISIILPVKDTAPYLSDCLQSIIDQEFKNWELIAINDHSNDLSLQILEEFAKVDSRINVFTNPNPGLLEALRFGYSKTSGNLIHRMDSDDKMPADKLELMHNEWVRHERGSVITGGAEYFMDNGIVGDGFIRYTAWLTQISKDNTHAANIYRESVIASNCWLVHREDFDAIGGFEPDTFPEDYDLCFRFYQGGFKIVGLDAILHLWRDRPDRISRNWDVYKDHRFFNLKVHYFFSIERNSNRPLVLWGAGKNGKDLAKLILNLESNFNWVCDNEKKIGKDIYGIRMERFEKIKDLNDPQIIIAVASPDGQKEIESILKSWNLKAGDDYWFFA
ncbi:MAG: glycosyltransferase family 2 protein [Crocinitomicaceae bacterium]|nr:glycosyltransferase family 2 protein [Crocinitomicaceae bacterium]